ncbi:MAG: HDOD domain-containing protein [Betaproteobacteria bacterium]|nr:HDOD domain-containing protein [Betaproteobacteria bacterium]
MKSGYPNGFEFIEGLAKELSAKNLVFPTSLNVTMSIRSALSDPDSSAEKVAHIVGAEPVLSAQLLRLANSVAINMGNKKITDLHTAITRLGYALVRNVAISVGMRQLTEADPHYAAHPRINGLWKHSILVAALAFVLAKKKTRLSPDEAMLAGMLHDIGKFYILYRAKNYPDLFADESALDEIIWQWHAEISQVILESWEIPEEIAIAARDHEFLDHNHGHPGPADLTDVVMVANILGCQDKPGIPDGFNWETAPSAFERLQLNAETCIEVVKESEEEIQLITQALA